MTVLFRITHIYAADDEGKINDNHLNGQVLDFMDHINILTAVARRLAG